MNDDPTTVFGSLLGVCVSDRIADKRPGVVEWAVLFLLGIGSSFLTIYVLSALGALV